MNNTELQELLDAFYTGSDQISKTISAIKELSDNYHKELLQREELIKLLNESKNSNAVEILENTKRHIEQEKAKKIDVFERIKVLEDRMKTIEGKIDFLIERANKTE